MNILLLGAYGFIGSALARSLSSRGHHVIGFGRDTGYGQRLLPSLAWIKGDLREFSRADGWVPLLDDVDLVINASGILQSGPDDNVSNSQERAIIALIDACARKDIAHFIQISAANAGDARQSDFMASKARADDYAIASPVAATVLRPGLVIGRNSYGGTELIRASASLPGVAVAITGAGTIQTVALDDVIEVVNRIVENPTQAGGVYDLVADRPYRLGQIIALHRNWLGIAPARWNLAIPLAMLRPASLIADTLGWLGWRSPLRSNAVKALSDGVSGNPDHARALLGRPATTLAATLSNMPSGKQDRWHARLALLLPAMLLSLIILWLASGVIGLVAFDDASALLVDLGMSPRAAAVLVGGGAIADIVLGLALLWRRSVKVALIGTIVLTASYLVASLFVRPDLWIDPLAPMIKALPALMLSLACLAMVDKR